MTKAELLALCRSKPGATEDRPFDETTLCLRVGGRIFALIESAGPGTVNLKCDPELSIDLRSAYPAIKPGWHMNHEHWITVELEAGLPEDLVSSLVTASYELIVSSLGPASRQAAGLPLKPRRGKGP